MTPHVVDARGLRCPLPVVQLARALDALEEGASVLLLATDPAARHDVPAFCRLRDRRLVTVTQEADHTAYLVENVTATGPVAVPQEPG